MSNYAVVIPSKTASNLLPCLTALRKHEPDCPVVVVDDGIGQQGVDQAFFAEPIEIMTGTKPFVFSRAVNQGIRCAMDNWAPDGFFLLNDDALLESTGGFRLLVQCCADDPSIGVIGATTNLTGQPLQNRQTGPGSGLRFVPHIAFVACYIPRTTLDLLAERSKTDSLITPGLDERYCIDYGVDDRDLCQQMEYLGLRVAVHDACYVDHESLTSTYRGRPTSPGSFAQNLKLFKEKWAGHRIAL